MMKEQYFEATPEMTQLFLRRIRFGGEKWAANHAFTAYQDRFLQKNPDRPELFEGYHPEYFAVGRTGGPHERQFCYTNQAFIKQVAKDACDYFDGQPLKGEQIALGDYFAVVPLDNANWCNVKNAVGNWLLIKIISGENTSIAVLPPITCGPSSTMWLKR